MKALMMFFAFFAVQFSAHAWEENHRMGMGLGLGIASPASPKTFTTYADGRYAGSLWHRRYIHPQLAKELSWTHYEFKGAIKNPTVDAFMGSWVYRFSQGDFSPTVGAGMGLAIVNDYPSAKNYQFTAQAKAGIDYNLPKNFSLGVEAFYTYVGGKGYKIAGEMGSYGAIVGLTYNMDCSSYLRWREKYKARMSCSGESKPSEAAPSQP